jgi:hypothetical protein
MYIHAPNLGKSNPSHNVSQHILQSSKQLLVRIRIDSFNRSVITTVLNIHTHLAPAMHFEMHSFKAFKIF